MTVQAILTLANNVSPAGNQKANYTSMLLKLMTSLSWLFAAYLPAQVLALLGPSGAVSYAVGFVARILQLEAKDRGFHLETSGFHSAGVHASARGFHSAVGFQARAVRPCHVRPGDQFARPSLNGAL